MENSLGSFLVGQDLPESTSAFIPSIHTEDFSNGAKICVYLPGCVLVFTVVFSVPSQRAQNEAAVMFRSLLVTARSTKNTAYYEHHQFIEL